MNATLQEVQQKLDEKCLRDVKFFFTDLHSVPNSQVTEQVAFILSSHLKGSVKPAKPLGDSQR